MGWPLTTKIIILQLKCIYRKHIIEDLEADLTGAPKEASNNDDVDFSEVANADEAITAEAKASNEMENNLK